MKYRLDEFRRLADGLDRGRIGRRTFLKRAAALGVSPLVAEATIRAVGLTVPGADWGAVQAQETGRLVVSSWGGQFGEAQREAHFAPFMEETGIDLVLSSQSPELALLEAQVTSGNVEWDIVNNSLVGAATAASKGLLQPINYSAMDSAIVAGADPFVRNKYSCGIYYWSSCLGWSTLDFPVDGPQPETWADLWNPEAFPGPRGLTGMDFEPPPMEVPLLAIGVAPEDLYPLSIDDAFAALTDFRDQIQTWLGWTADGMQLMMQGELSLATIGNGNYVSAVRDGLPVGMSFRQGMLYYDAWVIPRGAPNADLAHRFIEFTLRPEVQARFSSLYPVGAVTPAANDFLTPEQAAIALSNPELKRQMFQVDVGWWGALDPAAGKTNLEKVYDRWAEWIL
jgi:putative spermidine/putrescine transport system substrate-binding protein